MTWRQTCRKRSRHPRTFRLPKLVTVCTGTQHNTFPVSPLWQATYNVPTHIPVKRLPMSSSSDSKALHRVIRFISGLAVSSFYTEVRVIGGENVPKDGPIIVCVCPSVHQLLINGFYALRTATHHNMMLDPVILCAHSPPLFCAVPMINSYLQLWDFPIAAFSIIGAKVRFFWHVL